MTIAVNSLRFYPSNKRMPANVKMTMITELKYRKTAQMLLDRFHYLCLC